MALFYGATCIARDLRERRLSYYLSRPLSAAAIWAGRMLAGEGLALASFLIILVPGLTTGPTPGAPGWPEVKMLAGAAAALLACVAVGHALAVMLASRSGWLALDLVALVASGVATAWLLGVAAGTGDRDLIEGYVLLLTLGAAAGILGGGLAQVAVGRTDARSGHRALSLTLWSSFASFLLLAAGHTAFLLNPTPRSLNSLGSVWTGSRGTLVVLSGTTRGRGGCESTFAVDTASGHWLVLGRPHVDTPPLAVSADGRRAVWAERRGGRDADPSVVRCVEVGPEGPRERATTIVLKQRFGVRVALSPSGHLLAISEPPLLTVSEVDSGRLLASVRLADAEATALAFVTERRVRIEQRIGSREIAAETLVVSALDLPEGTAHETGRLHHDSGTPFLIGASPEFQTVAIQRWHDRELMLTLHDGWTLAPIAELRRGRFDSRTRADRWGAGTVSFLGDGRVVVGIADRTGARLDLFTAAGRPAGTVALGSWRDIGVGGLVSRGRIAVSLSRTLPLLLRDEVWDECVAVNLETGAQTRLGTGVTPFSALWWWVTRLPADEGSVRARLLLADDRLLLWEPEDGGRLRPLHGPPLPR